MPRLTPAFPCLVAAVRRCAGTDAYPGAVRLVSLLPSATEIVYALGLGADLVGVTFECDEPRQPGRRRQS